MAVAVLEDLTGTVDLVLFPEAFDRHGEMLNSGVILDVRGRLERRGESLQIVCESLTTELPVAGPDVLEPDTIVIRFGRATEAWAEIKAMQEVDAILKRHEGDCPVVIEIPALAGRSCRMMSRTRRSEWSLALERELRGVTGVLVAELVPAVPARLAS